MENLSVGKTQIKSVSQKIVGLEEQKEQLDIEIRNLNIQITQLKKKVVSTDTLKDTLTTFSALYAQATSEEKKELMQLYINQFVWTPEKIRLALFERPIEPQKVLTTSGKVQREALSGSGGRARTSVSRIPIRDKIHTKLRKIHTKQDIIYFATNGPKTKVYSI